MEVNLKSLRQADDKLGPDCNTGETISSIVILPNMFHSVQLQYSLFTPVQQFSILQYMGLASSQRLRCKYKNTLVSAEGECLQLRELGEAQTGFTQHGKYATILLCNQGRKRNLFGLQGLVRKIGPK
jgi:hypothetical protein